MSDLLLELIQGMLYVMVLSWISYLVMRIAEYARAIWELAWIMRLDRKIDAILDGGTDITEARDGGS